MVISNAENCPRIEIFDFFPNLFPLFEPNGPENLWKWTSASKYLAGGTLSTILGHLEMEINQEFKFFWQFSQWDMAISQWWKIFPQPMEVSGLLQPLVWVILRWKTLRTGSPLPWGLSISASKSASRFEKRSTFDCKKLFWGCGRLNGTLFKGFKQKNKFCTQELGF